MTNDALSPCPSCARHVRTSETSCPFCRAPVALSASLAMPSLVGLNRAQIFFFGAALTVAGCSGGEQAPTPAPDPNEDQSLAGAYGAPPMAQQPTTPPPTTTPAQEDRGNTDPAYGAPPPPDPAPGALE